MTGRTLSLTDSLYDYLVAHSVREPPILARLREATRALPHARMQIGAEQGQFMALLVKLIAARRCIEVGTFTGYSSLAVALALPADATLVTCDIDPETSAIARQFWREAGVAARARSISHSSMRTRRAIALITRSFSSSFARAGSLP
jgi:predicted O-methyltransferase YrrM